jgi:hypothetical protein
MKINGTFLSDTLIGTSGDDEINGYEGDDTIHGGDGNDTIYGGSGENWLFGDAGNDTIYSVLPFSNLLQVDHIDGGADYDTLYLQRDYTGWSSSLNLNLSDPTKAATLEDGTTITGIESLQLSPNMPEIAFDMHVHEAGDGDLTYNGKLFAHLDGAPLLSYSNFQIYNYIAG